MLGSQTRLVLIFSLSLVWPGFSEAQSFTPGNLAVLRAGNGTEALVNSGNSLFVDQYTVNGALVGTIAVPDSGAQALLISGTAGSEGGLTRSLDRAELILAGYNTNRGSITGSLSSQSGAAVPRAVAAVDAFGVYQLRAGSTTLYTSNNIRCAASDGTNDFWTSGSPGGTFYLSPPQAPVEVQTAGGNTRQVKIINGTLYYSTQAGTAGVYNFEGGGLPKNAANLLLVIPTGANSQPAGFTFNQASTIAYVADQRGTAGGIQKWTNNGAAWVLAYSLSTGAGAYDVAVDFSGSAPVIYATTGEANANRLISISDTGPLSIVKVLASAGANRVFRGIDFVPDLRPQILQSPASQTVTNGSTVALAVLVQSRYPVSFQWQKDGVNLTGANSSTLTLANVASGDQGAYRAVVTNAYGTATSASATLTVTQVLAAPAITGQPVSQTVAIGGNAAFSVSATGTAPLLYQWLLNGTALLNQTNASLSLNNVGPAAQGQYRVSVSNTAGTTNSSAASLTVLSPPASFVAYPSPGSSYRQDFNSLPDPGTVSVNADNPVTIAAVTYGLANPFDFAFPILPNSVDASTGIGLGGLGLSNTMPGWYALGQVGPKAGASAGDQSTGGAISFGLTNSLNASTNRALGLLATTSTGPTAFGLRLINQTTTSLNQITVSCVGELWRQAAVPKNLAVVYWIDASGTNEFSTNTTGRLPALDVAFAADPAATNPVPVDGTAPVNQISLSITNEPIADWTPGAALWLSWQMNDPAGKAQGLAIDNLVFSASTGSTGARPQLAIRQANGSVVVSWPTSFAGFLLQSSSNLAPGTWTPVSQAVIPTNGLNTVTLQIQSAEQFYRLQK